MSSARLRACLTLVLGLFMLLGMAGPAVASGAPVLAQEGSGELVRGTLKGGEGEPVSGVIITVTTPDGEAIGEATSGDDGTWEVTVGAPGDYLAELDTSTLPEGVDLRTPDRNPLEFDLRPGQARTLIFALGERSGGGGVGLFTRILQQTFSGLQFGLIIAMTAIGLSLIFGTTGLVNFAHGELVTLGAVIAWFFNSPGGIEMQLIPAAAIAIVLSGGFGAGLEAGLWKPLRRRRTGLIQMLVISIGLSLLLRNLIQVAFGGRSRPYLDYTIQSSFSIGPFTMTPRDLVILVLAVVTLVGVATMLQRTRIGKAMRAVADNRDLAESSGINVERVILFVWMLGGALAAFGGVLAGVDENVSFLLGFRLLLLMFAGVILGGLGTAYGAMVGSIVVGLVVELSTIWFSPELKVVWALIVLIVILLFRPQGLLGRKERIG